MHDSYYFVIFILIVYIYHFFILNKIEKIFCLEYFGYNNVKRPLTSIRMSSSEELGIPSGHTEVVTIISLLLYFYKYIPLWFCIFLIFIVSFQRIAYNYHTITQVIVGIICGVMYTHIYESYNLSLYSFGIVIIISLFLTALIYYKIVNK